MGSVHAIRIQAGNQINNNKGPGLTGPRKGRKTMKKKAVEEIMHYILRDIDELTRSALYDKEEYESDLKSALRSVNNDGRINSLAQMIWSCDCKISAYTDVIKFVVHEFDKALKAEEEGEGLP